MMEAFMQPAVFEQVEEEEEEEEKGTDAYGRVIINIRRILRTG